MMISVVIPCYNEEESIKPLYEQLTGALEPMDSEYELIFIDDGSTDKTYTNLYSIHENDSRIKIIKFRKNFGQSASLKAGFDTAKGDVVISMDGDLQNDPADIPKLVSTLYEKDYDVVCGWRAKRKDDASKKIFSKFANFLRRNITGDEIHDSGCTFRTYKNCCVKDLELYGESHRYIPAMLHWKGYRIGEIEVKHHPRQFGVTKYTWKRILKGFLDLIVISFWQKFSVRPIHVFGGMGLVLTITGTLVGGYLGLKRILFGDPLSDRPLFMLSILVLIIGIQFIVSGILADIMIKIYYSQKERKNYLIEKTVE